jgi:hypothetical protein
MYGWRAQQTSHTALDFLSEQRSIRLLHKMLLSSSKNFNQCKRLKWSSVKSAQCCKTIYSCNLWMFVISKSFVLRKPFRSSQMFASKVGAYPSEAPFSRCSTLGWAPGFANKSDWGGSKRQLQILDVNACLWLKAFMHYWLHTNETA